LCYGRSAGASKEEVIRLVPALCALICVARPDPASAAVVSAATFKPFAFGPVTSLYSDLSSAQSICAFGSLLTVGYNVLASGSGLGGAFTITNGTSSIPYEIQWAQIGGAASGANLTPNVLLNNQYESSLLQGVGCLLSATSATAIVIIRATSLQQATAGGYTGTLTLILTAQ
jgi:hypothetical protein